MGSDCFSSWSLHTFFTFEILSKDASLVMRKLEYYICENKGTDQLTEVTAKLISVFVVTTREVLLVHSLFCLTTKIQASSHIQLLGLHYMDMFDHKISQNALL